MKREKQRYLLIESMSKLPQDEKSFSYDLNKELVRCIGEINFHKVNPKFVKSVNDNSFIIKTTIEGAGALTLAFALIKRISNSDAAFYTLKSSGTIKALMKGR